jgi:anthranilate synthase/phosphoribosyltransferase
MRHAGPTRRELGVKTIMNLLGPLVNPAAAQYQLIGVYAKELVPIVAEAAHLLGIKRASVVHGLDGIDEISISASTRMITVNEDGSSTDTTIDPAEFGITGHRLEDLAGGTAVENVALAREVLAGKGRPAIRDAVAINAAAALAIYGIADTIGDGLKRVQSALSDGSVSEYVDRIVSASRKLAEKANKDRA